ncbi:hypothetical protein J6590_038308 [Homalodisca vitripennis]|nr:hypothetical protein J6590_038308 [Homalodisca vitripennis]
MMSTKHPANYVDTGKKTRQGEPNLKPLVVVEYNEAKMGIDVSDQMSSLQPSENLCDGIIKSQKSSCWVQRSSMPGSPTRMLRGVAKWTTRASQTSWTSPLIRNGNICRRGEEQEESPEKLQSLLCQSFTNWRPKSNQESQED